MEAVECGAAALGAVLGFYGRWEPLEALREECGVSRDGSTAGNMLLAARRYGLEAHGFRKETADLRDISPPAILHWDFNHFLVLEGIQGQSVYLNDPARGRREVTYQELDESFTGIVLTFSPTERFSPGGKPFRASKSLIERLRGSYSSLGYAVLAGLLLIVPGTALAIIVQIFVDDILVAGHHSWLLPVIFALCAVAALQMALTWLQQHALLRLETKLALTGTSGFLWHVMRLPMSFFIQRQAGDLGRRIALNPQLAQLVTSQGAMAAINSLAALFYLGVMLVYNARLATIAFVFAAVNFVVIRLVYERNSLTSQQLLAEQAKLQGTAVAGLFNIETIKATGQESDFFSKWSGHHARVLNAIRDYSLRTVVLSTLPTLLTSLSTAAILVVGGLEVIHSELTLGGLVGFQTLMTSFTTPLQTAANFSTQLQQAESQMKRLDDVLDHHEVAHFEGAARRNGRPELEGALELRGVTFGYSRLAPPLIEGFSLRLEPGTRVALVGGTGSGKSTIAKLVAGLYEPWDGSVLFDGRRREDLPREALVNGIAVVDQDILLFDGTIRENLAMWDETIPHESIVRAARDACIADDVAHRAGGYDAWLEEDGRNFSGGQRQRLEIARALVAEPRILILDEATSALDPLTEQRIDAALRRRGSTCLIIAHRLSTIRDCDEIIVLEQGKVIERGSHDELMRAGGEYAALAGMGG